MKQLLFLFFLFTYHLSVTAQGVISGMLNSENPIECGSYHFMEHLDEKDGQTLELSNNLLISINEIVATQKKSGSHKSLYTIPVVFHVVHNVSEENLHDSVIFNQLELLNACYRRQNADTIDTRPEFLDLVGDCNIQFELATVSPNGTPSTGITRTHTSVEYFGGVLPYTQSQTQQIGQWITDSLYYNFFRITDDNLGGKSPWDTKKYLNVWIGDLRIYEPHFNHLEELVFIGLGTPPQDHDNWPTSTLELFEDFEDGVIMHYVAVAPNNATPYPSPYHNFNGLANTGKALIHEVGHYLGLRHIWGDGNNCSADDYVDDTPNANSSSQYGCNHSKNTCTDNINGADLNDMIENFMDYTAEDCQNSFTFGQIDVMRTVLTDYRYELLEYTPIEETTSMNASMFPNPTTGQINLTLDETYEEITLKVFNLEGKQIDEKNYYNTSSIEYRKLLSKGIYFIQVNSSKQQKTYKVIVH